MQVSCAITLTAKMYTLLTLVWLPPYFGTHTRYVTTVLLLALL